MQRAAYLVGTFPMPQHVTSTSEGASGARPHGREGDSKIPADRWLQLFEAFPLPVVTLSADGLIIEANDAARGDRAGGEPPPAVIGRNVRDFVPAEEQRAIADAIHAAGTGEVTRFEVRYYERDGSLRSGEATIAPWLDPDGRAVALGILRDTSGEIEARHQLVQISKLATVGELLAGVSHELNNPLTAVLSYAELLAERDDVPEDARADLAELRREASRAAQIVRQLLGFVRRRDPMRLPVDINGIVRDTVALRNGELRRSGIEAALDFGDVPAVPADQYQLQQVVLNLLTNAEYAALRGSRPPAIRISTRRARNGVEVEVGDSGPGISPDMLPRVFDPFVTTKRAGEGTGLGLSIVHRIISEHGGRITAKNRPDAGALFTVFLPFEAPGGGA